MISDTQVCKVGRQAFTDNKSYRNSFQNKKIRHRISLKTKTNLSAEMDLCNNSKILIWQLYSKKDNRKILGVFSVIKTSNFRKSRKLLYSKTLKFIINKSWIWSEVCQAMFNGIICDDATKRTYCMLRTNLQWDTQWNMGKCYLKYLGFIMHLILNLFFRYCTFRNLLLLLSFWSYPYLVLQPHEAISKYGTSLKKKKIPLAKGIKQANKKSHFNHCNL